MTTYEVCLKVIDNSRYTKDELSIKFDMLYLMRSLDDEQYQELKVLLSPLDDVQCQELKTLLNQA